MALINTRKRSKRWNFGVSILILLTLIIIGLSLGGIKYAVSVFKGYMIGLAIFAGLYIVMLILGRTSLRKSKAFKRFTR